MAMYNPKKNVFIQNVDLKYINHWKNLGFIVLPQVSILKKAG